MTATKVKTAKNASASSLFVLDQKFIKNSQKNNLYELLDEVAVVQINKSGPGGTVTLQLKGAESGHVLVILDGLILNDPINTNSLFDFNQLSLQGIEKIEILPGSQSVIYGASAIGGVINIFSKSGKSLSSILIGAGNHNTFDASNHFSTKLGDTFINFGYSFEKSEGYNATTYTSNSPAEKDGFQKQNLSLVLRNKNNLIGEIQLNSRVHFLENELDRGFNFERDDENYTAEDKFYFHSLKIKPKIDYELIDPEIYLGISKADRNVLDLPDSLASTTDTHSYQSEILQLKIHNIFYLSNNDILISGFDFNHESGSFDLDISGVQTVFSEKNETHIGFYSHYQLNYDPLILNLGLRIENHRSNLNLVYKIGPSYMFRKSNLKLYSLFSTGFKTPSLYQLHSQFGNTGLDSETSVHLEAGLEKYFTIGSINLSVFNTEIVNLIDLEGVYPNSLYTNSSDITIRGLTIEGKLKIQPKVFDYQFNIQFLNALNGLTDQKLINRPSSKFTQMVNFHWGINHYSLTHIFSSSRKGGSTTSPEYLPSFHLLNGSYRHEITNDFHLKSHILNIFNTEYEQVSGFQTGGRTWKATAEYYY
ncbi:MAG: TonB-dependent receptor [Bacteriovoracaceae bacterium]|nr:TonB-dependent receptor [Bacteriovoracaceae bacterium]